MARRCARTGRNSMRYEKTVRLLKVARALAANAEGMTLDDIAEVAEVERRTAERLRDALRELFPTLEEIQDGARKRFRIRDGLQRFMQAPTAAELAELSLAVKALRRNKDPSRAETLESLAGKVRATLKPEINRRIGPDVEAITKAETTVVQIGPRPLEDPVVLAAIRQAVMAGALCVFNYPTPRDRNLRRRQVRPFGVLFGKSYYLVGPELGRPEPTLWRLDRMTDVEVGGPAKPAPASFDLLAYAAQSVGVFQEAPINVELRFAPSAARDARRFMFHPTQTFHEAGDGSLIVRVRSGGQLELVRHLFTWGDAVEILKPASLRRLMVRELRRSLGRYEVT